MQVLALEMVLVMVVQEIMAAMVQETVLEMMELVPQTVLEMAIHQGLGLHQIQEMVYLMEAVSHHHHHLVLKLNRHKAFSGFTAGISKSTYRYLTKLLSRAVMPCSFFLIPTKR